MDSADNDVGSPASAGGNTNSVTESHVFEGSDTPVSESGVRGNWSTRDVVVGLSIIFLWRLIPYIGVEQIALLPSWVLFGAMLALPQAFFLIYPLALAKRRGVTLFHRPDLKILLTEFAVVLPILLGLLLTLMLVAYFIQRLAPNSPGPAEYVQQVSSRRGIWYAISILLLSFTVAPVCEEVFFRRFLQGALRQRLSFVPATIVQCFLFAMLHTFGTIHNGLVFLMGLVLTALHFWRKTLLAPILLHAGNNLFTAFVVSVWLYVNAFGPALGVQMQDHPEGCRIEMIVPDSPAARVGIVPGDFITAVNGQPIHRAAELSQTIKFRRVGETVRLRVSRNGGIREIDVKLESKPEGGR